MIHAFGATTIICDSIDIRFEKNKISTFIGIKVNAIAFMTQFKNFNFQLKLFEENMRNIFFYCNKNFGWYLRARIKKIE